MLRQVANVLAHLFGPRGAVQANHIGLHGIKGNQGCTDFGSRQHSTRQLDRHLHLNGNFSAYLSHGIPAAVHACLDSEKVKLGFEQQEVNATSDESSRLLRNLITQFLVANVAERGKAGARPNRASHKSRLLWCRIIIGGLPGNTCRHLIEFFGSIPEAVLVERGAHSAKGVGLDNVCARVKVLGV